VKDYFLNEWQFVWLFSYKYTYYVYKMISYLYILTQCEMRLYTMNYNQQCMYTYYTLLIVKFVLIIFKTLLVLCQYNIQVTNNFTYVIRLNLDHLHSSIFISRNLFGILES